MISYQSAFVPSLHQMHRPMDHPLGKNVLWTKVKEYNPAFSKLESALNSNIALTPHNSKLPIIVAADASSHGIDSHISSPSSLMSSNEINAWRVLRVLSTLRMPLRLTDKCHFGSICHKLDLFKWQQCYWAWSVHTVCFNNEHSIDHNSLGAGLYGT